MLHAGKSVLITGGSRGLGRALALEFAREGADVAITYLTEAALADQVVAEIRKFGVKGVALQADFCEPKTVSSLSESVGAHMKGLDILIANAATGVMEPLSQVSAKHWQKTLNANSLALVLLVQAFMHSLRERAGTVLAISSMGAVRALPRYGLVGASKAALESVVRQLAFELGPVGIRVNAITPGLMDSDVLSLFEEREQIISEAARRTPLGRIVSPAEVAAVASFIASSGGSFIHGQTINVDGGYGIVG